MHHLLSSLAHLTRLARRPRDDRGDVPGWVLITVMTVAIVTAIWGFAKPELVGMLRTALNSVN